MVTLMDTLLLMVNGLMVTLMFLKIFHKYFLVYLFTKEYVLEKIWNLIYKPLLNITYSFRHIVTDAFQTATSHFCSCHIDSQLDNIILQTNQQNLQHPMLNRSQKTNHLSSQGIQMDLQNQCNIIFIGSAALT